MGDVYVVLCIGICRVKQHMGGRDSGRKVLEITWWHRGSWRWVSTKDTHIHIERERDTHTHIERERNTYTHIERERDAHTHTHYKYVCE